MTNDDHAKYNARAWHEELTAWVAGDFGETEAGVDEAEAREAARPDPLSVQVRSGWAEPGKPLALANGQYELLLTTGGPALRIIGDLDGYCEPTNARLEWKGFGTPWTEFPCDRTPLLTYAQSFYFGEG